MEERFIPKAQEIYRHFKGNLYQVIAVAEHTETGEQLVIYQALYGDFGIYARPLSMFISPVDRTKYPDASQEFRFQLQGPDAERQLKAGWQQEPAGQAEPASRTEQSVLAAAGTGSNICRDSLTARAPEGGAAVREPRSEESEMGPWSKESETGFQPEEPETESQPEEPETESQPEEPRLDPLVLEFLDARTYEQRLNVLAALHHRITNEMITTMSLCCDIEVEGEDVEQRYEDLKQCLMMKERFEIKRLV